MRIIDTGTKSAEENMELDIQLLASLEQEDTPFFHFYDWSAPSATYGYFVDPAKYLKNTPLLQLARRPTGGGIIFHLTDFAFSFLMPASHPHFSKNTLENYSYVNKLISEALPTGTTLLDDEALSDPSPKFCMANPTIFDIMVNGKKVGGSAQRRTKAGYLHQGSILLSLPPEDLLETVILDKAVLANMRANSHPLLGIHATTRQILEAKKAIRASIASR